MRERWRDERKGKYICNYQRGKVKEDRAVRDMERYIREGVSTREFLYFFIQSKNVEKLIITETN